MIAVSVRKDRITVSGHAGFAEAGKDIVCAGVTALLQTLIKAASNLTEDKIDYEILGVYQKQGCFWWMPFSLASV